MRYHLQLILWLAWFAAAVPATTSLGQLVVDRATGTIELSPIVGEQVNSYSIESPNGLLDPTGWTSLADQSLDGWNEANPLATGLSELNPFGFTEATADAWQLGNAYTGITAAPRDEDLTLRYSLADGTIVDGTVEYVGPANDLTLKIDPNSGNANIELNSANVGSFDLIGYGIFSDGGSLHFDGFTGLGSNWTNATTAPVVIGELNATSSTLFETATSASIGNIFTPGGAQDVRFEFATADGSVQPGTVVYATIEGVACDPGTNGDLDGNGVVEFADFLTLSGNFGQMVGSHEEGDIDCNGTVEFADFLTLSGNFGQNVGVATVPEPQTFGLLFLGAIGLLSLRNRQSSAAKLALVIVAGVFLASATTPTVMAVDFDTRMIVLDPDNPGDNAQINSAIEARGILRGTVTDVNILEDVTDTVGAIDFAGAPGAFDFINNPYPNGVSDDSLSDFVVQVTGNLEIPAGDWTIGFNTDDGGILTLPRVDFVATGNQNGATDVPGELIFNGTRGAAWTFGHFSVPEGETLRTEFEGIFFERSGGDVIEVAILDEFVGADDLGIGGVELEDGIFNWEVLSSGPAPGDFNWDESIDVADFEVMRDNFLTGTTFAQGDLNGDGRVDTEDFTALVPLLTPPGAVAALATVPEPTSFALLPLLLALLTAMRTRR